MVRHLLKPWIVLTARKIRDIDENSFLGIDTQLHPWNTESADSSPMIPKRSDPMQRCSWPIELWRSGWGRRREELSLNGFRPLSLKNDSTAPFRSRDASGKVSTARRGIFPERQYGKINQAFRVGCGDKGMEGCQMSNPEVQSNVQNSAIFISTGNRGSLTRMPSRLYSSR